MNMIAQPETRQPTTHDLNYTERLVLHALRQWVQNRALWSEVVLEFNRACGPRAATRLCDALDELFCDLGINARRHLRLYPPLCCQISQDELCVLNLIAAQQAGASRHAAAILDWLVPEAAARRIGQCTREIARELFETGYTLNHRTSESGRQVDGAGLLRVLL